MEESNIIKYNKCIIDHIISEGDNNYVLFGKYYGNTYNYVYENYKSYCRWILKNLDIKNTINIKKRLSMLLFKQWLEKVSLYDPSICPRTSITR